MQHKISKTFAPPRPPLKPKVIPLFATPAVVRRSRRIPTLHQDLPAQPRFHPYGRHRRGVLANSGAESDSDSSTPALPQVDASETHTSSPHGDDGDQSDPQLEDRRAQPILIKRPRNFSLANAGWKSPLTKALRKCGKEAIQMYLQVGTRLSKQDQKAISMARAMILDAFPDFKNHQNFWGANAVLRDQLRNMKDTNNARLRKQKKDADSSSDASDDNNPHL